MRRPLPRKLFALGLAAACGALSTEAAAQITNVLNKVRDADEDGLSYLFSGRLDWRSGNVDRIDLQGATTLIGRTGRHLVLVSALGQFAARNDERFVARHLEHARYRVTVAGPLELESFVQHDFNEFRRRSVRVVFGAGPRLVVPTPHRLRQAFGVAYMPEYERLSEGDFADSGLARWHHRISSYSSTGVQITERVALGFTLFLQPAINAIHNIRMFSELSFDFHIVGPLQLDLSWVMQLDTEPPESVRPTDSTRLLGLSLEL